MLLDSDPQTAAHGSPEANFRNRVGNDAAHAGSGLTAGYTPICAMNPQQIAGNRAAEQDGSYPAPPPTTGAKMKTILCLMVCQTFLLFWIALNITPQASAEEVHSVRIVGWNALVSRPIPVKCID